MWGETPGKMTSTTCVFSTHRSAVSCKMGLFWAPHGHNGLLQIQQSQDSGKEKEKPYTSLSAGEGVFSLAPQLPSDFSSALTWSNSSVPHVCRGDQGREGCCVCVSVCARVCVCPFVCSLYGRELEEWLWVGNQQRLSHHAL